MPDVLSPIDGAVAFSWSELSLEAAGARVRHAAHVQRAFQETPLEDRVALVLRALEAYGARLDDNARAITRATGKPLSQAKAEFERSMRERVGVLAGLAGEALAERALPHRTGFDRRIRREPVGVVLVIAAWNYPLLVPTGPLFTSVLAGNAVLLKHAPQTMFVGEQLERAFREAGAPEGLVQSLPVSHETLEAVLAAEGRHVGFVSFTGSVRGGREVHRAVGAHTLAPTGLELGGNDPAIVFADCDFEFAVENVMDGRFYNAGQSCCAVERVYVERSLHDRFVEALVEKTKTYRLADPFDAATTLGPVVGVQAARRVRAQVADARARGARVALAEDAFERPTATEAWVAPTLLVNVDHEMEIMREETFGPALGVMPFHTDDEAVALANDSRYGLTASIWTRDADRARRVAARLEAGTVYQNRCDYLDPEQPWTGWKESGTGASLGREGFLAVTRPKNLHFRF